MNKKKRSTRVASGGLLGHRVEIKQNLKSVLEKLHFDADAIERVSDFVGDKHPDIGEPLKALAIWKDKISGTTFVTVDMCVEIPIQCVRWPNVES